MYLFIINDNGFITNNSVKPIILCSHVIIKKYLIVNHTYLTDIVTNKL